MKSFLCFIFIFALVLTIASAAKVDEGKIAICAKPDAVEKAAGDPRLLLIF
ncbi:hypothetical protein [Hyphococcus sp.]|uniref:hypothetical protein n=1 Tax=Hyphococcus sp. TaxID=2038636 RepID=UPI0035C69593